MTHMCHKKKSCYTNVTSRIRYVDWSERVPENLHTLEMATSEKEIVLLIWLVGNKLRMRVP